MKQTKNGKGHFHGSSEFIDVFPTGNHKAIFHWIQIFHF